MFNTMNTMQGVPKWGSVQQKVCCSKQVHFNQSQNILHRLPLFGEYYMTNGSLFTSLSWQWMRQWMRFIDGYSSIVMKMWNYQHEFHSCSSMLQYVPSLYSPESHQHLMFPAFLHNPILHKTLKTKLAITVFPWFSGLYIGATHTLFQCKTFFFIFLPACIGPDGLPRAVSIKMMMLYKM